MRATFLNLNAGAGDFPEAQGEHLDPHPPGPWLQGSLQGALGRNRRGAAGSRPLRAPCKGLCKHGHVSLQSLYDYYDYYFSDN